MPAPQKNLVTEFRKTTFRLNDEGRINNQEQALDYIVQRGFIFFWPVKGIPYPNLWSAVAGDRLVPHEHDDPGHVTWGWKDQALGMRIWYYAKILRNKATFVSLDVLPYFYALSENYGSPEEDFQIAYQDGKLTVEEKVVYESILNNGPMHTIELKQASRMTGTENKSRFNRALEKLQSDFRILPVGVADAGTWKYAFIYDLTSRHYPELPARSRLIGEWDAYKKLLELFFLSMGAANLIDIQRLFRWNPMVTQKVLEMLQNTGFLASNIEQSESETYQYYLPQLLI